MEFSNALEAARSRWAVVCLGVAVAVSGALLIGLDSHLTFVADDWALVVKRRGWGAGDFLDPFHGSLIAGPAATYRLLREVFGFGSSLPYYVVAISAFLTSAVLLFVYLRRRVSDWLALLGAILLLFLGAAFEDLLFAFQVGYFASVAAGLGMLIALDREDDRGDRIACALLATSIAFSSCGLAFAVGALADLTLGPRPKARRAYVALLPIALYGLWWIGWGHAAKNHVGFENVVDAPRFVFEAAAAGVTSLLGLATGDGSEASQPHLIWGKLLVAAGVALLALGVVRERKVSRGLLMALAMGIAFWALAALNRDLSRLPTSSRYQYPSAVFLLLILAEMLRGRRIPKLAYAAGAAVAVAAVVGGASLLHREYSEHWVPYADSLRTTLAAAQIAGTAGDPLYPINFPPDVRVSDRVYLSAVREHGSPAFSDARLAARPEADRVAADLTLDALLGIRLAKPDGETRTSRCRTLRASPSGRADAVVLRPGGYTLNAADSATVNPRLGRFSPRYPIEFGMLEPGAEMSLTIPVDESPRPWRLALTGDGPVRLCTAAPR